MTVLLQNKLFISTRPKGKSEELRQILQSYGAEFLEMPMIEIQQAEISPAEKEIMKGSYQWIIFTSANGIVHFFGQLKKITGNSTIGQAKIAAIGGRTAKELLKFGYTADYINSGKTSENLVDELRVLFGSSLPRVLLPLGNLAGITFEEALKSYSTIYRVNVYKTVMPEKIESIPLQRIIDNNYGMIIFTSPSGFINFSEITKNKINIGSIRAACIGSTTAKALTQNNVNPLITSETMSSKGIANAIIEYYKEKM